MNGQIGLKGDGISARELIKDFRWFSATIGGLSIVSILQAVFVDHDLAQVLQRVVDAYNVILAIVTGIAEPALTWTADVISDALHVDVTVQSFWRSLFALAMVFVVSVSRSLWPESKRSAGIALSFGGLGAFLGAAISGVMPLAGGWPIQAVLASLPISAALIGIKLGESMAEADFDPYITISWLTTTRFSSFALALGAAGALVLPSLAGWGLGALALAVACMGTIFLVVGLTERDLQLARLGTTALGGFAAALIFLLSDLALRALSAG